MKPGPGNPFRSPMWVIGIHCLWWGLSVPQQEGRAEADLGLDPENSDMTCRSPKWKLTLLKVKKQNKTKQLAILR